MHHTITLTPPLVEGEGALPPSAFRRVTEMATRLVEVPIAMVQVRATALGRSKPVRGRVPAALVARIDPAIAPPTNETVQILENPARAAASLGLAFHARVPLRVRSGPTVGALAVFDVGPRELDARDRQTLEDLAAVAAEEIEVWLATRQTAAPAAIAFERALNDDTATLLAALRDVSAYEDPTTVRPAICRIAASLTAADAAALYEVADDGLALLPVVTVGATWSWPSASLNDPFAVARAYVTGKAVLEVRGAEAGGGADPADVGVPVTPAVSFWQPFAAGGPTTAAVIALAWDRPGAVAPARVTRLMDTLAAEAIRAIERADLLVRLDELTRTDELTGLPNRRALNEVLPREMERARRETHGLCLAMLDLDHFKRYNDSYGHPAGDRLLAEAAGNWRDVLRSGTDFLARYGGEEFAVVLPTSLDAAHETLERMRRSTPHGQTVSIGVAAWDGHETATALIARADAALYAAKAGGRDTIRYAGSADAEPRAVGPGEAARSARL